MAAAAPARPRLPPFLAKMLELLDTRSLSAIVSWSADGHSVVIHQASAFSSDVLPLYFKTASYTSFVRQLHIYGFHKTADDGAGCHTYRNDGFYRGMSADAAALIKRRTNVRETRAREANAATDAAVEWAGDADHVDLATGVRSDSPAARADHRTTRRRARGGAALQRPPQTHVEHSRDTGTDSESGPAPQYEGGRSYHGDAEGLAVLSYGSSKGSPSMHQAAASPLHIVASEAAARFSNGQRLSDAREHSPAPPPSKRPRWTANGDDARAAPSHDARIASNGDGEGDDANHGMMEEVEDDGVAYSMSPPELSAAHPTPGHLYPGAAAAAAAPMRRWQAAALRGPEDRSVEWAAYDAPHRYAGMAIAGVKRPREPALDRAVHGQAADSGRVLLPPAAAHPHYAMAHMGMYPGPYPLPGYHGHHEMTWMPPAAPPPVPMFAAGMMASSMQRELDVRGHPSDAGRIVQRLPGGLPRFTPSSLVATLRAPRAGASAGQAEAASASGSAFALGSMELGSAGSGPPPPSALAMPLMQLVAAQADLWARVGLLESHNDTLQRDVSALFTHTHRLDQQQAVVNVTLRTALDSGVFAVKAALRRLPDEGRALLGVDKQRDPERPRRRDAVKSAAKRAVAATASASPAAAVPAVSPVIPALSSTEAPPPAPAASPAPETAATPAPAGTPTLAATLAPAPVPDSAPVSDPSPAAAPAQ